MGVFYKKIIFYGIYITGCFLLFEGCGTISPKDAEKISQEKSAGEPQSLGIRLVQENMDLQAEEEAEPEYGEMTEDFYFRIEDVFSVQGKEGIAVVGISQNSPVYTNAEVDICSIFREEPISADVLSIVNLEENAPWIVEGVAAESRAVLFLSNAEADDVCVNDVILLRGHEADLTAGMDQVFEQRMDAIMEAELPEGMEYIRAYADIIRQSRGEIDPEEFYRRTYRLIYVDEDDVPELVISGYYCIYLYTYSNGKVYCLMDGWGYGAMGNAGYTYLPEQNVLFNTNSNYAGLERYIYYGRINNKHELDWFRILRIEATEYDDVCIYENDFFYEDQKITREEFDSYIIEGEYESIAGLYKIWELWDELQDMIMGSD